MLAARLLLEVGLVDLCQVLGGLFLDLSVRRTAIIIVDAINKTVLIFQFGGLFRDCSEVVR